MKMRPEKNQVTWAITIFVLAVALMLAYYIIFDGTTLARSIGGVIDSLSGIIIGIVIAFVLLPLLEGIEEKILYPFFKLIGKETSEFDKKDKKRRGQIRKIAVLLTMIIFMLIAYSLFRIIIPQLVDSIKEIATNLPIYVKNVDEYSNLFLSNNPDLQKIIDSQLDAYYENLSEFLTKKLIPMMPNVNTIVKVASKSVFSIVGGIINLIVGIIVAIYVLNSKEKFTTVGKKMAYSLFRENFANELIGGFRFTKTTFENFIGGKIIDSLIIGVICYIGALLLKIDYPVLISVIVGVTIIIPFFGPYIGGIAGALLLVLIDPIEALIFLIFVIVLQQFDGNILGPMILGSSTGLSSFWVIFSITLFGGMWGIVGWLIGVPIFAVFYAFVGWITNILLAKRNLSTNTEDYYDLAYIEDKQYKPLSDKENVKFNASKEADTFKKIFNVDGIKEAARQKKVAKTEKTKEQTEKKELDERH